jgi:hypothetical protein
MLTLLAFVTVPSILSLQNIPRKNHRRNSHKTNPNQIDKVEIDRLQNIGFSYNETTKQWQRSKLNEEKKYGVSEPRNRALELLWKKDAETAYTKEENDIYFNYLQNRKKTSTFKSKEMNQTRDISPDKMKMLERLGFSYNSDKKQWKRGQPRFTPITLEVISKQRSLKIEAPPEAAEALQKAVYRLDYLLSQTALESPTNIWDGVLRVGRDPVAFFIWSVIQYKIWTIFSQNNVILQDAFSNTPYFLHNNIDIPIITGLSIFLALGRIQQKIWDESSGPITIGSFERTIADGILTNFTSAPLSYKNRENLGISWKIIVAILTSIASIPRSVIFHEYIQPKIQNFAPTILPMSDSLNPSLLQTKTIVITCIMCATISVLVELISLRWARFSKSPFEEILYLSESIKMDAIHERMIQKRLENNDSIHSNNKLIEHQLKQHKADSQLFESIATSWAQYFIPQYNFTHLHNQDDPLDMENIFLSKKLPPVDTSRTIYLLLTHFISTQILVLSYIFTDIYTPILFHTAKEITNLIPLNKKILRNASIEIIPAK